MQPCRVRHHACSNIVLQVATVLNNHFDTDGLLSAYTLLYPEHALKHRKVLCRLLPSSQNCHLGMCPENPPLETKSFLCLDPIA